MYRNACYCKLKKQLEELQKEIKENYSGDTALSSRVTEIQRELVENTTNDTELRERVEVIEAEIQPADPSDIDDLFPDEP